MEIVTSRRISISPLKSFKHSLRPRSFHLIQSDGWENRVFLRNTDSQNHSARKEGRNLLLQIKGQWKQANPECYYSLSEMGDWFQSHSLPFAWSPCLASKSSGSWVQPAKFSSNVIESASAKLVLSHLQIPEMRGYKLLGLPFVIMKCKLVRSCMTTLHYMLLWVAWSKCDWRSNHKAELDLGWLHFWT